MGTCRDLLLAKQRLNPFILHSRVFYVINYTAVSIHRYPTVKLASCVYYGAQCHLPAVNKIENFYKSPWIYVI